MMKAGTHRRWFVTVLVCAVMSPIALGATTWHVGTDANEVATIQAAVDKAAAGDTIVLRPGTYTGLGNCDVDLQGKALTIQSTNPLDPNTVERTIIDCAGSQKDPHQGFSVVGCKGAVLSGLTITHGAALAGGAVYCRDSTLDLTHCRILDNAALPGNDVDLNGGPGGGVYCQNSIVQVVGCLISGNTAGNGAASKDGQAGVGGYGAGICGVKSDISVVSSIITGNAAGAGGDSSEAQAGRGGDGGGLFGNSIQLIDSTVSLNKAGAGGQGVSSGRGGQGGGICADSAVVDRAVIEANRAGDGATAPADANSSGSGGGDGGGIYAGSLEIADSLIAGNLAGQGYAGAAGSIVQGNGGGIWCAAGTIRQCTVAENVVYQAAASTGQGAGVFCTTNTTVTGSILYGNTPDQIAGYSSRNVTYCNLKVPADSSGAGITVESPLFVQNGKWVNAKDLQTAAEPNDPNAVWVQGDYRLQTTSPLLDGGDPNYVVATDETDLAGNVRVSDAAIDIGAYESKALVPLYRFESPTPGKCFYTADEAEKTWIIQQWPDVWAFQGISYYVYSRAVDPNLKPVYRFWSGLFFSHFYTISEEEKNQVIDLYPDVWDYEGAAFYAYPAASHPAGTLPVYRFWSDALTGHSYTISEAEKDKWTNESPKVWTYESIAWYAYADSKGGVVDSNVAVYEFSGGTSEAVYTLSLKALVDGKEVKIDNPDLSFTAETGYMKMTVDWRAMTAILNEFLWESTSLSHSATIGGDGAAVQIPIVLTGSVMFWGRTARGPFAIDSKALTFPTAGSGDLAGTSDEAFTLRGSVTVNGNKLDAGLVRKATTFATGKEGTFDTSALPDQINARMDGTFQWSRQGQEDLLLETTVNGSVLQLYVVSSQIQTAGVWQGKKSQ